MKTYLDYKGFEVLAHRGGSLESYENTIESFEYSINLGCKYIETDVQLSLDGKPYIFHDDSIKRLTGRDLIFNDLHSNEIDKIRIFDNLEIPLLEDVLLKFPDTYFQIDVKTDEVAMPALKVIHQTNSEKRVCIASFSSPRLARVRREYPEICLSMGPKEILRLLLSSYGLYKKKIQGDCLQVPVYHRGLKIVTKRFVNFIHSKGLKIVVWTINDEKTMKELFEIGVDGIITDEPKKLFQVIS
jgi:glycerophosphoryl diester phosphodiesterase